MPVPGVAQTIVVCRLRTVLKLGRPRKTMACPTAKLKDVKKNPVVEATVTGVSGRSSGDPAAARAGSEAVIRFDKAKRAVAVSREDGGDDAAATGVAEIQSYSESTRDLIIAADVE